jgi:hypothetical protein
MAARAATGPAHVAVVSFLAARAAPTGGFWIALAGGVALARVAAHRGARLGFGASVAAMLETVAIIGPARVGVPLTQAISAPMLGRLHARGAGFWPQFLACASVRLLHNAATTAFFIWVITGGLDAYAGTYDAVGRRVGIEVGSADALALTLAGLVAWAVFASTVQVLVYRRGLQAWAGAPATQVAEKRAGKRNDLLPPGPFDPRAVAAAALVAFVLLLSSTAWALLAAVLAWLTLAWALSRPEHRPIAAGLALAAVHVVMVPTARLGGGLERGRGLAASLAPMGIALNDEIRRLFDGRHFAVLATINPDGGPQTSAMWVGRDGDEVLQHRFPVRSRSPEPTRVPARRRRRRSAPARTHSSRPRVLRR